MRESASTDLREPQWSNPLGPPGPELSPASASGRSWVWSVSFMLLSVSLGSDRFAPIGLLGVRPI